MVTFGEKFYYIINLLRLDHVDKFVKGSAKNNWLQAPVFFVVHETDRFSFNFLTTHYTEKDVYECCWFQIDLNTDFAQILRKYGRLPIASLEEGMRYVREHEAQRMQIQMQKLIYRQKVNSKQLEMTQEDNSSLRQQVN